MPGRPLRDSDISPSLEGQRAEMFWPDDNLWYLVEIATVDMRTHQVRITYTFISVYMIVLQGAARGGCGGWPQQSHVLHVTQSAG